MRFDCWSDHMWQCKKEGKSGAKTNRRFMAAVLICIGLIGFYDTARAWRRLRSVSDSTMSVIAALLQLSA